MTDSNATSSDATDSTQSDSNATDSNENDSDRTDSDTPGRSRSSGEIREPASEQGQAGSSGKEEGAGGTNPHRRITGEEWARLRAPFSMAAYVVDVRATAQPVGEGGPQKAVVDLTLRAQAVLDRLDNVLGPGGYSCRFEPATQAGRTAVYCHLRVGGVSRSGIGARSKLRIARKAALAGAARAFGIGQTGRGAGPMLTDYTTDHVFPEGTRDQVESRSERSFWTPTGDPPEEYLAEVGQ